MKRGGRREREVERVGREGGRARERETEREREERERSRERREGERDE